MDTKEWTYKKVKRNMVNSPVINKRAHRLYMKRICRLKWIANLTEEEKQRQRVLEKARQKRAEFKNPEKWLERNRARCKRWYDKNKIEARKKIIERTKKYRKEKRPFAIRERMKDTLRRSGNTEFTTSKGIKIKIFIRSVYYCYTASKGLFHYIKVGFTRLRDCRNHIKQEFGL